MGSVKELPGGYAAAETIDLQHDKRAMLLVNGAAVVLMVLLCIAGDRVVPLSTLFDLTVGPTLYIGRLAVMLVGLVVYLVLHELVHGVCMKHFGAEKVRYGFTGVYAYAGSDAYFYRGPYIIIALAPIVVWGVVLLVLNCAVGPDWFWSVYFIQVCNISGAADDLYVTVRLLRMPADTLVRDTGVTMTVYRRE